MEQEMQSMTPTSLVALFEMNKVSRQNFVTMVVDAIDAGNVDPLKVHLQVKNMEKIIEQLTSEEKGGENAKRYRRHLLEAAQKHGGKKFDYYGASLEIKEMGVKYDFSQCNDPEHAQLTQDLERTKAALKSREDFLKTVPPKGMDVRVDDEMVTVYPPSKSSTTAVQCTLK